MADPNRNLDLLRERLLGWGVALKPVFPGMDLGRDIVFASYASGRDLAVVRSMANLSQDLEVSLTTLLGDDPFNVSFGFDGLNALARETNPILQRERVRMSVIGTLQQDPRVERILDVKLAGGWLGDETVDDAERIRLKRSRTLHVEVAFQTVSGDRAVIQLGEVPINV